MTAAARRLRVVMVGAVAPTAAALQGPVRTMTARGATVDLLLLNRPADGTVLTGLPVSTRRLALTRRSAGGPDVPHGLRRWYDAGSYRLLRLVDRRASPRARVLRRMRRDPEARAVLARADVLVALDRHCVHPVWRAARRVRPAFYGAAAAARFVDRGRDTG